METPEASASLQQKARVLSAAVCSVADRLEINNAELAMILGLSPATVSRLRRGDYALAPNRKEFELGALLVRLYRGLAAIVSGDDNATRSWLRTHNLALRQPPIAAIRSVAGLVETVGYVDARRAPI